MGTVHNRRREPVIGTKSRSFSEIGAPSFLVPARKNQPELLDMGIGSPQDVRANLADMWRTNRFLGGIHALTHHLFPLLSQSSQPVTLVDIGAGSAEMGVFLLRWAKQRALPLTLYALDISARNLSVAREKTASASLLQADACALPFAKHQVDFFISSLFLHHLSPQQVVEVLKATYASSRRGIVMSDLVRGYLPRLGFDLIQPFFARHYLTRHDGQLSIERAYTPGELLSLAQVAGLQSAQVYSHFPWRMTLVAEKPRV